MIVIPAPPAALFSGMWAAAAMHATAEDLARFVRRCSGAICSVDFYFPNDGLTAAVLGNAMVDLQPVAMALYGAHWQHKE